MAPKSPSRAPIQDIPKGRAALARVGRTPAARARWLLQFVAHDLATLPQRKAERIAWEVSAYIEARLPRRHRHVVRPVELDAMRQCQTWLKDGLNDLRTAGVWNFAIVLPTRHIVQLVPRSFYAVVGLQTGFVPFREVFTLESGFVFADRLYFCPAPRCTRPFVRRKGQRYCSRRCSQRVRTARFRVEHPEYSKERYRKKLERKMGGRVRIQPRTSRQPEP